MASRGKCAELAQEFPSLVVTSGLALVPRNLRAVQPAYASWSLIVSLWKSKSESGRQSKKKSKSIRKRARRNLLGEVLEQRNVLATYVVDSLLDTVDANDNVTTLREAVNAANSDQATDLITFASSLAGGTIELATIANTAYGNSALAITTEMTIDGSNTPGLTIGRNAGATNLRQFFIDTTGNLTIDAITVANGNVKGGNGASGSGFSNGGGSGGGGAGLGGAFYNRGILVIADSTLNNNTATGGFSGVPVASASAGGGGGGMIGNGNLASGSNPGAGGTGGGGSGGAPGVDGTNATYGGGGGGGGNGSNSNSGGGGAGGFGGGGGGAGGYNSSSYTGGSAGVGGFGGGNGAAGTANGFTSGAGGRGGGGAGMGGAIFNDDGRLYITNTTLTANTATGGVGANSGQGLGGAIFTRGGIFTLTGVTIAANSASTTGGGVYVYQETGLPTSVTAVSSIVASSLSGTEDFVAYDSGNYLSVSGNENISTTYSANLASLIEISDSPDLGALADNGGPTYTMMPSANSNAIGEGANPKGLTYDQRGYLYRTINGLTDVGAVQHNAVPYSPPVISSISRTDPTVEDTDAESLEFTIVFDEAVTGVDASQIELTGTAAADCTIDSLNGSGTTYTVVVQNNDAAGSLGLNVKQGVIKNADDQLYAGTVNSSQEYWLMQAIVVDTLSDIVDPQDNLTSLREAVVYANQQAGADLIKFDADLAYGTIELATIGNTDYGNSALEITSEIYIDGSTAPFLTIGRSSSQTNMRQFFIDTTGVLTLESITVSGGQVIGQNSGNTRFGGTGGGGGGFGGAIFNRGTLNVVDSTLSGNSATGGTASSVINTGVGSGGSGGGGMIGGSLNVNGTTGSAGGTGGGGGGGNRATTGTPGAAGTFGGGGGGGGQGSGTGGTGGIGGFGGGGGGGGTATNRGMGGAGGFGGGDGAQAPSGSLGGRGGGGAGMGGAIFNDLGTVNIVNSTLSANTATGGLGSTSGSGYGGAVFSRVGTVNINNSTIDSNAASTTGGAVFIYQGDNGQTATVEVDSSILADSISSTHDFVTQTSGGSISASGADNVITSHNSGSLSPLVTYQASPELMPLANYGGPTQTMMPSASSNTIGHGANPLNLATDQRGFVRSYNGTTDIGAVQVTLIPVVNSITRTSPTNQDTNVNEVMFTLSFNTNVSGVDASQLELTGSAAVNASITQVTGSGAIYTVKVDTTNANGSVGLNVLTGVIKEGQSNLYDGETLESETYSVNHTIPVIDQIIRLTPTAEYTNANQVTLNISFSEIVTGVDANQITLTGTAAANATITQVLGGGTDFNVYVDTTNANGTLGISVATGVIQDLYGNLYAGTIQSNETYSIERTAPVISSITRGNPTSQNTNANSVEFTVTFDEAVTGVAANQLSLTGTAAANASITQVQGSGTTYTVTVNTTNANGTLGLDVLTGQIVDAYGNLFAGTINTSESYTIEHTAPVVSTIVRGNPTSQNTNANSVEFTVTFDEAVTGVDANQFSLTGSAGANASITQVQGSGTTYTVTVNTANASGTLGVSVATGTIVDAYGNLYAGTIQSSETYSIEHTAPVVATITRDNPTSAKTNVNSVTFAVTFNESVTGVQQSNFTLTGAGATGSSVTSFSGSGTTYSVVVDTTTAEGELNLEVSGTNIVDAYGNAFTGTISSQETYDINHAAPVVSSIARTTPTSETTGANSVVFTVTFDEAVTGVAANQISLTGTAAANASITNVTGSNSNYFVTVNTTNASGTLGLSVSTGQIKDEYGNLYTGQVSNTETYTIEHAAPVVTSIARTTPPDEVTDADSVFFTITFDEDVTGVDASQIELSGTAATDASITQVTGSGSIYTVTVDTASATGTLGLNVLTGEIKDLAGNLFDGTIDSSETYTIDHTPPLSVLAVGTYPGKKSKPIVNVYDANTGTQLSSIMVYGSSFSGGVQVAVGDLTGDDIPEIVVTPASKRPLEVKVFTPWGEELTNLSFAAAYKKDKLGASVTVGDVNGDGWNDIITSSNGSQRSVVRVFQNNYATSPDQAFAMPATAEFEAFGKKYNTGVSLATGDVNNDGADDVIVGSNQGQITQIAVFSMLDPQVWTFTQILSITPFGSTFKGGVSVSAGDIDGDGHADIIAGAGKKGNSQVQIFNGSSGAAMGNPFTAFPSNTNLPVNVCAKDLNGDGLIDEIFTAVGSDSKDIPVKRYLPNGQPSPSGVDFVLETDKAFSYGIELG